jgi:hypothetical protein
MYTILVQDDNTLQASVRSTIMHGSKNIDELHFLAKPIYHNIDMTELSAVLTYILPVSKERKTLTLIKSEELYKDRLEYKILLNNDENYITSEVGEVKLWLTFLNNENIVRYTTPIIITVYPTEVTKNEANNINEVQAVDNLYLDKNTNSLYLTSNGTTVGEPISINDLSDALVDGSNDGLVTVITE